MNDKFDELATKFLDKKISRRKLLSDAVKIGVSASFVGMFLTACSNTSSGSSSSGSGSDSNGTTVIEFWTISLAGPFGDWIKGFIKKYERTHKNVQIKWVDVPGADVQQKYLTAVSGRQAPALANVYGLPKLVQLGALVDINQYISKEEKAKYYDSMWKALTFNGKTYGIPWYGGDSGALVYSKKLFEQAGLDPNNPPKTFKEALDVSKIVKNKTGKYGLMTVVGQADKKIDGGNELDWFVMEGVDLFTPDFKEPAFNTPKAEQILTDWMEFYKGGYLPPEALTAVWSEAEQWYTSGRGAFTLVGGQILNRATPDVLAQLGTEVSPPLTGELGKALTNFQYFVISNQTKDPKAAVDYALYVTGDQLQLEFCKQVAIMPSRPAVLKDKIFQIGTPKDLKEKARKIGIEWNDKTITSPSALPPVTSWADISKVFAQYLQQMYTGSLKPKQVLNQAEADWARILKQ